MSDEAIWRPDPERRRQTRLAEFVRRLAASRGVRFAGYEDLWRWSVAEPDAFWSALFEFFEIKADGDPHPALASAAMPGAKWFPGVSLNYAEHVFRDRDQAATALRHSSELRGPASVTWGELEAEVAAVAAGMARLGVGSGDRVAAYLPNILEAVVGFLAAASLGAIWSSCSPDFGSAAAVDRFAQIEPKLLLAVDGYRYGGRDFDRRRAVEEIQAQLPSLEATVLVPYLGVGPGATSGPRSLTWEELKAAPAEPRFTRVAFEHPLWILYSSGTTGPPKPIVQGQGGILLEHLKVLELQLDLGPEDRFFWFTTTGWMMWNLLVSVLLTGAEVVLYDGNPAAPDLGALWDLAERDGVTVFGTSPAYLSTCMKEGLEPRHGRGLERLRCVASTGAPLPPEAFDWLQEQLGKHLWIVSLSGGTDLCTAFLGGVPTRPVYRGELQGPALGAPVAAFDPDGRSVIDAVGELVLTGPMPSMPLYLWGDEDGSRYRESYFSTYPGVWRHGDWIEIKSTGGAVISGRSDATINRGGVRIGSAEIYRAVLAQPEIVDALVVDVPKPGTEGWMTLFVVCAEGARLDDELRATLRRSVREYCSPRHVPDEITQIPEVPRTRSGKALEIPVKQILMGADPRRVVSPGAIANPEALDRIAELAGR